MDIPWAQPCLWGDEETYVSEALRSTWLSGGPYVEKLEQDLARYHGVRFCLTTSSGTSALQLALLAVGVGRGDQVVVPGFSFMAAANMAIAAGAQPAYADIDPDTWCMDPASVDRKISRKTKAIVAIHPYGNVCDMRALRHLAAQRKLFLIEDAAEAMFSRYRGRLAGTLSDIGCFSFQATKTITTGEGGCVLTSERTLFERMRLIRNHGLAQRGRYWHSAVGHNFRLTNLQAALGCAQFTHRTKIIAAKRTVHALYRKYLKHEPGIRLQRFAPNVRPVVWCVAIEIDPSVFGASRDQVMTRLGRFGIETRPGFCPPSLMPLYHAPSLPVAERISAQIISLPSFPALTERQITYVCNRVTQLKQARP